MYYYARGPHGPWDTVPTVTVRTGRGTLLSQDSRAVDAYSIYEKHGPYSGRAYYLLLIRLTVRTGREVL